MNFVPLQYFTNYIDANIVLGRLQQENIHCWLKDENTVTIDPILTQAVGGIKLMVAEEDVERAQQLLNMNSPSYFKCPKCGSHNVQLVSSPRKPLNWISSILGFLLGSYAVAVDKVNHCFDCGYEFDAVLSPE
jgi:predicted RNA-binding Zn-ribbon protein involved in translation (DUF1610 family)